MRDKLKIMIAGTANPHIPSYLSGGRRNMDKLKIITVSDFDTARLDNARKTRAPRSDVGFYADYQAMFAAHPEAEAVVIGSDNVDHFKMFKAAAERKLHIYMMKVISMDEDECLEMVEFEKHYDRVVQCELELHFNPQFQQARRVVRSGVLGEIKSVYFSNVSQSPCNYFPNWGDPVLSYGKKVPIRPDADCYRGGAITDHPHPYDLIRWIFGCEFRTVFAMSAPNQRDHLKVEDHAAISGELDNGMTYFVNPSYSNLEEKVPARRLLWPKSLECNLKITGTKGYFAADFFDRHVYVVGNNHVSPDRLIVEGTPRLTGNPDNSLIGSFVATIAGKRATPETTLADSFAAVRVMNAAYESIYTGNVQEVECS